MADGQRDAGDKAGYADGPLPARFADRAALADFLASHFPETAARDGRHPATQGGRAAAEARLAAVDPAAYGRTRSHLDGTVTRLSPYIRHGVLSLGEVRDRALAVVEKPDQARKLIFELAWRDYWRRVYAEIGEAGVWTDREPYKTGWAATDYARALPAEIPAGETGLVCIDSFAEELAETGYLHNHARMYVAAYVVHWRRVAWQAGAAWFLLHLLDGDPASNNLSWQWVASTFGGKPYIWNRENLEKYSDGRFCRVCPHSGHCPFDGSYAALAEQLFPYRGAQA